MFAPLTIDPSVASLAALVFFFLSRAGLHHSTTSPGSASVPSSLDAVRTVQRARNVARDIATTDAYITSRRERKKVEMLFAHLKRILKLDRLRLRGPNGARDEFHLAAAAPNLRKLAKLIPMPRLTPA